MKINRAHQRATSHAPRSISGPTSAGYLDKIRSVIDHLIHTAEPDDKQPSAADRIAGLLNKS